MARIEDDIRTINQKLQLLIKKHVQLRSENELLKASLKEAKDKQKELSILSSDLEQKVMILKTSVQKMGEADKKIFEKKIDQYIDTIDKCIAELSE